MPLEDFPPSVLDSPVSLLNARFGRMPAEAVLRRLLPAGGAGAPVALVSAFGAESAVLLHMVAEIAPRTPVLFIDTELLFAETLDYQRALSRRLGLADTRVLRPSREELFAGDPDGLLHHFDPDACCALRKVAPLQRALAGFDGWISGRKTWQGGARARMPLFERDPAGRLKVNPLRGWDRERIAEYFEHHDLPRHPLVARGYASLGCRPCTTPVRPGESPRAGRWRGLDKSECGIHLSPDGRVERGAA